MNAKAGIALPEAYSIHRDTVANKADQLDPVILARIRRGAETVAADYIDLLRIRRELILRSRKATRDFDAMLLPTVPIVAPTFDEVATPEAFMQKDALILRNTRLVNFLDRCAITLPIHTPGEAPVGLMLIGEHGHDRRLISVGLGVEAALAQR